MVRRSFLLCASTIAALIATSTLGIGTPTHMTREGMVQVPSGSFSMGCKDCNMDDALPVHLVKVSGFWLDETVVTNADFEKFVASTGYQTIAERPLDPKDYPGVPVDKLVPGASVFTPPTNSVDLADYTAWWAYVPGASWKHPRGPKSDLTGIADHPVTQVAWEDADAYCKWKGKRLPTEAEFEYAARGGLEGKRYSWGDELKPKGKWMANIWQGRFPTSNTHEDGFERTSPVRAFPKNGYGLHDVAGNVWQWCSDWYRADYYQTLAQSKKPVRDPKGPSDSFDPLEPGVKKRVQKGGSFLCTDRYCTRHLVGSRGKGAVDSGASNLGFRCAQD